jgi:hypothetical protein
MKIRIVCVGLVLLSALSFGQEQYLDKKNITFVAVNGQTSSPNSGVTCVKVNSGLVSQCLGYVAIKDNNEALLSAALHAKATGNQVWFYYEDAAGKNHCPGKVFTPCAVNSIGLY